MCGGETGALLLIFFFNYCTCCFWGDEGAGTLLLILYFNFFGITWHIIFVKGLGRTGALLLTLNFWNYCTYFFGWIGGNGALLLIWMCIWLKNLNVRKKWTSKSVFKSTFYRIKHELNRFMFFTILTRNSTKNHTNIENDVHRKQHSNRSLKKKNNLTRNFSVTFVRCWLDNIL